MLQQPEAEDFIIATGEQHSVREFVERAASHCDMQIQWKGNGLDETGLDTKTGKVVVRIDARYFRPTEVESLLGDASKAKAKLGWSAEVGFESLVQEMIDSDREFARRDALISREGFKTFRYRE